MLLLSCNIIAQTPYYIWTNMIQKAGAGAANDDNGVNAVTKDQQGNLFVYGYFSNTVDIDPGPSYTPFTSNGNYDLYVAKFDPNGAMLWARQFGGIGAELAYPNNSIACDANGNVYFSGTFQNTVDFDPGAGVANLISGSADHGFICKLSPAGYYVWAKSLDGGTNSPSAIEITTNSELVLSGYFFGTVDFDPNAGTNNLSAASSDGFICKWDSSGNHIWSEQLAGGGSSAVNYLKSDPSGNIFLSGSYFNGTTDLNPGAGTFNVSQTGFVNKAFILKLDPSGSFLWAIQPNGSTGQTYAPSIGTGPTGEFFMTGEYETSIYSVTSTATAPKTNIYIAELDPSNGSLLWAKNIGGPTSNDQAKQPFISIDQFTDIYVTGALVGSLDLNPGAGNYTVTTPSNNMFALKLNSLGTFMWGGQFGDNTASQSVQAICANNGDVYIGGYFSQSADFDPGSGNSFTTPSVVGQHSFITKWSTCPAAQIVSQTGSVNVCQGNSTYFAVQANVPGVSYQWQINSGSGYSNLVADAHHNFVNTYYLSVSNVIASMNTNLYRCIVSTPCGADTSAEAVLNVLQTPLIITQPLAISSCSGDSILFRTEVQGSGLNYQWYENNLPLSTTVQYLGTTTDSLHINSTVNGMNGNTYYCSVYNSCGSVNSDTVLLTLNPSYTQNIAASICSGDSYTFGPLVLFASGNYTRSLTTINGCDSIVNLALTVNPTYNQNISAGICSGDSYTLGTQILTTSGNYTETFTSITGCDSIINLTLTVNPAYNQNISASICNGDSYTLGTQTLTTSGTYSETFNTVHGCDSVINLSLTVNMVNTNVTQIQDTLIASAVAANYQWYNCSLSTIIAGETNQQFIAASNGDYAVIITENSCTDTSGCYNINVVELQNIFADNSITISPNPFNDKLLIKFPVENTNITIEILDLSGRIIQQQHYKDMQTILLNTTELAEGIYFIKVSAAAKVYQHKLMLAR